MALKEARLRRCPGVAPCSQRSRHTNHYSLICSNSHAHISAYLSSACNTSGSDSDSVAFLGLQALTSEPSPSCMDSTHHFVTLVWSDSPAPLWTTPHSGCRCRCDTCLQPPRGGLRHQAAGASGLGSPYSPRVPSPPGHHDCAAGSSCTHELTCYLLNGIRRATRIEWRGAVSNPRYARRPAVGYPQLSAEKLVQVNRGSVRVGDEEILRTRGQSDGAHRTDPDWLPTLRRIDVRTVRAILDGRTPSGSRGRGHPRRAARERAEELESHVADLQPDPRQSSWASSNRRSDPNRLPRTRERLRHL